MTAPMRQLIRAQRLRDVLAAVAEWQHASGTDRVAWRRNALHGLRQFRTLHLIPERQAFLAAVQRSEQRRTSP